MKSLMDFITDFGDQAVLLPLIVVTGGGFAASGWRRGAYAWLIGISATYLVTLLLKLTLLDCSGTDAGTISSPSGHTAAAAIVYGTLLGIACRVLTRRISLILLPAAVVGSIIGISRVLLGVHSVAEVTLGAAVGIVGAWGTLLAAGDPPPGLRRRRIAAASLLLLVLLHGMRFPAEAAIRALQSEWPVSFCR